MNCEELKSSVLRWFGDEIECHASDRDALIVTLPLLKPNGDAIEIGIEPKGGRQWKLSDLGDTYSTLYLTSVDLPEEYVRGQEFRQIIDAHRIQDQQRELSVETSDDELIDRMFDFVHAIQSMLALQLTVRHDQPSRDFASIVARFLAEQHASFEVPTHVDGKTGRWKFNFVLNHVREETLIKTLSVVGRTQAMRRAEESVFEIRDVAALRGTVNAIVIADDEGDRDALWGPPVSRIFDGYDVPMYTFEGSRQKLIELAGRYVAQ
jgi:hypothetical protein